MLIDVICFAPRCTAVEIDLFEVPVSRAAYSHVGKNEHTRIRQGFCKFGRVHEFPSTTALSNSAAFPPSAARVQCGYLRQLYTMPGQVYSPSIYEVAEVKVRDQRPWQEQ